MAERTHYSEKPKQYFLKKLFFVTAGLLAGGVIAIELLPKIAHIFGHEIGELQASRGMSHLVLRRSVMSSS